MPSQHTVSARKVITAWVTLFLQFVMLTSAAWSPAVAAQPTSQHPVKIITLSSAVTAAELAAQQQISFAQFKDLNPQLGSLTPETPLAAGVHVVVAETQTKRRDQENTLAGRHAAQAAALAQTLGQDHSSDALKRLAESKLSNAVNLHASEWLNQFGQAQVGLDYKTKGGFAGSYADVLFPLLDKQDALYYTQVGMRRDDSRWTANLGLGMRHFYGGAMYGINTFYDQDVTGNNRRAGIGGELARDYLKLSVNGYLRLRGWHASRDFTDYNERAANGYDVRLDGWLPTYPNLGASLIYERYFGREVALFDNTSRQHNPQALTAKINYTPIPLVTVSTGHRFGTGGRADTRLDLLLSYRLGEALSDQLDVNHVAATRNLMGSRYDLVNRNNRITLDYQKKRLIWLALPQNLRIESRRLLTIDSELTSKYAIDRIEWDISELLAAGGKLMQQGAKNIQIIAPPYQLDNTGGVKNHYRINATAVDIQGNRSRLATTTLEVIPEPASIGEINITKDSALANGADYDEVVFTLLLADGQPAASVPVSFSTTSQAQLSTQSALSDEHGNVILRVTHTKAVTVPIQVELSSETRQVQLQFIADASTARIDEQTFMVTENNALANGASQDKIRGRIIDAMGNPVAQLNAHIAVDEIQPSANDVTSDSNGDFYVSFTSTKADTFNVQVTVNNDTKTLPIRFIADASSAALTLEALNDKSIANGIAQNRIRLTVKDKFANPVPNQVVTLAADNGAHPTVERVTTDAEGHAEFGVFSTKAGYADVHATVGSQTQPITVQFIADSSTAAIGLYEVVVDGVVADGEARNVVKALIHDKYDNPVTDLNVRFTVEQNGTLVDTQSTTNDAGEVSTGITSEKATSMGVTLTVNDQAASVSVRFIPNMATATIDDASFTLQPRQLVNAIVPFSLQVKDATGNPVPKAQVELVATNGATLSSTSVTTDDNGMAMATVTNSTYGNTDVTARINYSAIERSTVFLQMTGIKDAKVKGVGKDFDINQGFPTTAIKDANFTLVVNANKTEASNFTWSSSDPGVEVAANGMVKFLDKPVSPTVTITGTDALQNTLTYRFTITKWGITAGETGVTYDVAKALCQSMNARLPNQEDITLGTNIRGVGRLYAEWGTLPIKSLFWSDDPKHHFHQDTGYYHENTDSLYLTMCIK